MAEMGIYTITHIPTGRQYIGSTVSVERRFRQQRTALMHTVSEIPRLQSDWDRDGPAAFSFGVVESVSRVEDLYPAECRWIAQLRPFYNSRRPARHRRDRPESGRPTAAAVRDRFWANVDLSGGLFACWPWLKCRQTQGYGQTFFRGRLWLASRVAWTLTRGEIPDGLCVLHDCPGGADNPACVNPAHLWLGTRADNNRDMAAKGRHASQLYVGYMPRGDASPARRHPERLARGARHPSRVRPGYLPRGESHPQAKLTDDLVREIRARYIPGVMGALRLAHEYGLDKATIYQIVKRKTWKHID